MLRIAYVNGYVGDRGAALTLRSSLTFRWAIVMNDQVHESKVCVRADNASERGVPFPAAWRKELNFGTARSVVDVDALARSAVRRVFMKSILCLRLRSSIAGGRAHIHIHVQLLRSCANLHIWVYMNVCERS